MDGGEREYGVSKVYYRFNDKGVSMTAQREKVNNSENYI